MVRCGGEGGGGVTRARAGVIIDNFQRLKVCRRGGSSECLAVRVRVGVTRHVTRQNVLRLHSRAGGDGRLCVAVQVAEGVGEAAPGTHACTARCVGWSARVERSLCGLVRMRGALATIHRVVVVVVRSAVSWDRWSALAVACVWVCVDGLAFAVLRAAVLRAAVLRAAVLRAAMLRSRGCSRARLLACIDWWP